MVIKAKNQIMLQQKIQWNKVDVELIDIEIIAVQIKDLILKALESVEKQSNTTMLVNLLVYWKGHCRIRTTPKTNRSYELSFFERDEKHAFISRE